MDSNNMTLVMIPKEEWTVLLAVQQDILRQLKELSTREVPGVPVNHITAKEFMDAVRIKRTKFDQLVQTNKIKSIKKGRKIYVPASEVERYFNDPMIQ
jgi:thiaminase